MKRSIPLFLLITLALILSACGQALAQASAPEQAAAPQAEANETEVPQAADPQSAAPDISAASETAVPAAVERPLLDTGYENALTPRLLLSFGALKLAETATPINAEQAPQLLMLWQALTNLTNSGTSAEEEVTALLTQIEATLTPEQIAAINAMKLTQAEMQTWSQANGIAMGTGTGGSQGQGGGGSGLSAEARATRQAENGKTGTAGNENGISAAITQALLAYLQNIK